MSDIRDELNTEASLKNHHPVFYFDIIYKRVNRKMQDIYVTCRGDKDKGSKTARFQTGGVY